MKVPATSLAELETDFEEAEQTVLSSYADALSGGSELMTTMPALADSDYGENLRNSIRSRDGASDKKDEQILSNIDDFRRKSKIQIPDIERTIIKLSKQPKEAGLWARLLQRVAGWMAGGVQVFFLFFYQSIVDPAHPNTWPVDFFRKVTNGPLKSSMLSFFSTSGDFTRRLISVKANGKFSAPGAGPGQRAWFSEAQDFRSVVNDFRNTYGVRFVYCWHGLPAYWGGVMPQVREFEDLKGQIVYPKPTPGLREIEPAMLWNPAVLAGIGIVDDPDALYTRMHEYLAQSGVDGVKVDCQAGLGLVGSVAGGGPSLANKFHCALEKSIVKHFPGNHAINCMCHSTENIYQMRHSALIRASDDFYPREPASSTPHVSACAYNSLFLSVIGQPDWDMFQSLHPAAHLHACARAVSGGPVYVSDKVGRHDFNILRKLVLRDGSVLRANRPGLPTADCIFRDPMRDNETLLKVWTTNNFTGVVGVFHLQGASWNRVLRRFTMEDGTKDALWARVHVEDCEGMDTIASRAAQGATQTETVAVLRHSSGEVTLLDERDRCSCIRLEASSADVLTMAPVVRSLRDVEHAVLGLGNMLNGGGAIQSIKYGAEGLEVGVRGEGDLVMYSNHVPVHVEVDSVQVHQGDDGGWWYAREALHISVTATDPTASLMHTVRVCF